MGVGAFGSCVSVEDRSQNRTSNLPISFALSAARVRALDSVFSLSLILPAVLVIIAKHHFKLSVCQLWIILSYLTVLLWELINIYEHI